MTQEPENHRPKEDGKARRASEHPMEAASTPESGEERMVRRRFSAPVILAVIAVVVLLAIILF